MIASKVPAPPLSRHASPVTSTGARSLAWVLGRHRYRATYYGRGRDPESRAGLSGYERYTRDTSNADVVAYLLWRFFPPGRVLDAGCAQGFVVEALRELDIDAEGIDTSRWAIAHAPRSVAPFVRRADLAKRLPFPSGSFDVVTALETLEHVPPQRVPHALAELRRVCRGWVVATIPSFGPNRGGPPGWLEGKVRDERLADLYALGSDFDGPVAEADLARDAKGNLLEGHVTIASYRWWTSQFEAAGFVRCPAIERRLHPHVAVRAHPRLVPLRDADAGHVHRTDRHQGSRVAPRGERAWRLDERRPAAADIELLRLGLGEDAVREALVAVR